MSSSKHIKRIREFVKPYGLKLIQNPKGHAKVVDKEGHFLIGLSSTPSDRYATKNVLRDLIRYGHVPKEAIKEYRKHRS